MSELVMKYCALLVLAFGLIVLGYGIRMLQEAVREYLGSPR